MRRRVAVAGCALSLLLAGCEQGADVAVRQEGGVVTIAATRIRSSKPACLSDVAVYRTAVTREAPLWHIFAAPEAACTRQVMLGTVPAGFGTDAPASLRLQRGGRYRVDVAGNGFIGAATFTAR